MVSAVDFGVVDSYDEEKVFRWGWPLADYYNADRTVGVVGGTESEGCGGHVRGFQFFVLLQIYEQQ